VHPSVCNWYYYAQFIVKPKAACALRFSWAATSSNLQLGGDVEQPWLMSKNDVIDKTGNT